MSTTLFSVPGFFIGHSFRQAWGVFKQHWLKIWGIMLLPMAAGFLYSLVVDPARGFLSLILGIAYMVVQLWVSLTMMHMLVNIVRHGKVDWSDFQTLAPRIPSYLGGVILYCLIVIGGLILLIVPGIIWAVKYMWIPYLIADQGLSPMEAMKKSGQLTKGIKWDLFAFMMMAGILAYSGVLLLVVGLVVTIPVATLSYYCVYELLVSQKAKAGK